MVSKEKFNIYRLFRLFLMKEKICIICNYIKYILFFVMEISFDYFQMLFEMKRVLQKDLSSFPPVFIKKNN